jgi:hypothetical protein
VTGQLWGGRALKCAVSSIARLIPVRAVLSVSAQRGGGGAR